MEFRTTLKTSLFAAALVLGAAGAGHAQGQTPVATPDNQGGYSQGNAINQEQMNRNSGASGTMQGEPGWSAGARTTTGAGVYNDPTTSPAADPQKRSLDDPKQYGHPDRH